MTELAALHRRVTEHRRHYAATHSGRLPRDAGVEPFEITAAELDALKRADAIGEHQDGGPAFWFDGWQRFTVATPPEAA